jgi:hypothetical protein
MSRDNELCPVSPIRLIRPIHLTDLSDPTDRSDPTRHNKLCHLCFARCRSQFHFVNFKANEPRRAEIISYVPFIGPGSPQTKLNARFHVLNFTGLGSRDEKMDGADRPD